MLYIQRSPLPQAAEKHHKKTLASTGKETISQPRQPAKNIMINYRKAEISDVEQLANLHANSWRNTYRGMMSDEFLDGDAVSNRIKVWNERLSKQRVDQFVLLAEEDKKLVGFICAYCNEDPGWGSYIDNLHVVPEFKRCKVGTSLMMHAANWLNNHAPQAGVYLWVMEANTAARRFYDLLGASNAGVIDKVDPAGGSARNCRYIWSSPDYLAGAANMSFG